mgnify:CR=1 FL=1
MHTAERESLPSMYKLVIKNSAKKELDDIPAAQFLKIDAAILLLKTNPLKAGKIWTSKPSV